MTKWIQHGKSPNIGEIRRQQRDLTNNIGFKEVEEDRKNNKKAPIIVHQADINDYGIVQFEGNKKIIISENGNKLGSIKEGKGKLCYPNGKLKYEGSFKNDLYGGKGKLYYDNGNIQFEGNFKEGKCNKGTEYYRFKNGKIKYEGTFENGLYNGKGKRFFNDGSIYEGNFKKGKFEGKGKFTYYDGEICEGIFKNGSYDENFKRLTGL